MFNATVCLTCKDDTSHEGFRECYENSHAPRVDDVPGIRKYTLAFIESDDSPYDSVAEFHFDDETAYDRAMSSDLMVELVADVDNSANADEMLLVAGEGSTLIDTPEASR